MGYTTLVHSPSIEIPKKSTCACLIVTKTIVVFVCPALSYSAFGKVCHLYGHESNTTEAGHMRSFNTYPYWSIRKEAPVSLLRQSVMPTGITRARYMSQHTVSSL